METIKKYLAEIASDENQVKDFLEKNETEIRSFFAELWRKHSPAAAAQPVAEAAADNQQAQTGTQRFNAGVQPDNEKAKNDSLAFQIKNKQIAFQNGKVGQAYCVDFDIETLGIPDIAEVTFEGLEAIGLQHLPEEKCIKGNPTQAGDHKIEMKFKRKDWEEGKPLLVREVVFIINPDPRVLWSKNIPTPEDIEYYKPDSGKLFVKVASKKTKGVFGLGKKELARKDMVAASQRGRSHAIEGKPRDDDFLLYFDEEAEWYVMVVADGAGSAQFSRKGSQIACQTVIEVCQEKIAAKKGDFSKLKATEQKNEIGKILQEIISNAVFSAHKTIETEAKEKGRPIKDYATTLLVSLCKKFDYGWFVGAWWVGDGGIGIYRKEPEYLKVLGEPDGGEFAGQTRFLTMPDIIQKELYTRIRFDVVEDFTALILMTDGVTDPKFETDANLNRIEKWHALWDDLNGSNEDSVSVAFSDDSEQVAEQLLRWLDFWSKGNHDDRTIAILF
ncbi:MAG: protein phosphatase 2C domain-containing protein [Prevotellaceae bacterium]|jgi:serine/threonine protein phosphatase PrpC|nr:protein phosphatase 2C domain-containing protein [Prevotellaceae bacterium]